MEPFAGSLAVLLRRPHKPGNEIINDLDCYVSNAWRAMKFASDEVAEYCDWPSNEADLHARHRWLHGRLEFRERMEHDPDYFDARIAGYWIWGLSCWIGDNFCRPARNASVPHLTGGQGVARQVPHLTGGKGEQQPPSFSAGLGGQNGCPQSQALSQWFAEIARRLRFAKVCCGEWGRVLTKASTWGQGLTGVLLDPPYDEPEHGDVYGDMSRGVSDSVREWALKNGDNPLLRIAYCSYGTEPMPGWKRVRWKASGGYGNSSGNDNCERETIDFSPHCCEPEPLLFDL